MATAIRARFGLPGRAQRCLAWLGRRRALVLWTYVLLLVVFTTIELIIWPGVFFRLVSPRPPTPEEALAATSRPTGFFRPRIEDPYRALGELVGLRVNLARKNQPSKEEIAILMQVPQAIEARIKRTDESAQKYMQYWSGLLAAKTDFFRMASVAALETQYGRAWYELMVFDEYRPFLIESMQMNDIASSVAVHLIGSALTEEDYYAAKSVLDALQGYEERLKHVAEQSSRLTPITPLLKTSR
jgi:hypothetical protein